MANLKRFYFVGLLFLEEWEIMFSFINVILNSHGIAKENYSAGKFYKPFAYIPTGILEHFDYFS